MAATRNKVMRVYHRILWNPEPSKVTGLSGAQSGVLTLFYFNMYMVRS